MQESREIDKLLNRHDVVQTYDAHQRDAFHGDGLRWIAACESVRAKGGKVTREAGPVKGGTTVIAFVEDPDGYKIELIERERA